MGDWQLLSAKPNKRRAGQVGVGIAKAFTAEGHWLGGGPPGFPSNAIYSATKGGVDMITSVLARELGGRKIRVNSLNPGLVETEGATAFLGGDFEKMAVAMTPPGRVGHQSVIVL